MVLSPASGWEDGLAVIWYPPRDPDGCARPVKLCRLRKAIRLCGKQRMHRRVFVDKVWYPPADGTASLPAVRGRITQFQLLQDKQRVRSMCEVERLTEGHLTEACYLSQETGTPLRLPAEVRLLRELGCGFRARVFAGSYRERPVVLKVYTRACMDRFRRRLGISAGEFEFARNMQFYNRPELRPFVARPLRVWLERDGWTECFAQELIEGSTLREWIDSRGTIPLDLARQVRDLCHRAWSAELYDLDLQFKNIVVVEERGELRPKLFDFNLIPANLMLPRGLRYWASRLGRRAFTRRDRRWLRRIWQASQAAPLRRRQALADRRASA